MPIPDAVAPENRELTKQDGNSVRMGVARKELAYAAVRYAQKVLESRGWTATGDRTWTNGRQNLYVPDIDVERGAFRGVDQILEYLVERIGGVTEPRGGGLTTHDGRPVRWFAQDHHSNTVACLSCNCFHGPTEPCGEDTYDLEGKVVFGT